MSAFTQTTSDEPNRTQGQNLTERWISGTKTALSLLTILLLLAAMVGFPLAAIAYP